jgi:pilus assembly protein TadC
MGKFILYFSRLALSLQKIKRKEKIMVYIVIDEKKRKGKSLLRFLKNIDREREFVNFIDDEPQTLENEIITAMNTPRVKAGNSLREILSVDGI